MPTVIDSLIVTLGLDPKSFNAGQQQALNQLRQFQQQAQRTAQLLNTTTGRQIQQFFSGLGAPINAVNQNLNNLTNQSRRTGSAVASAANVGATGLTNLAAAGLAAYTALKSVQSVLGSVLAATNRGAEVGRAAPEIGAPVRWVDAFTRAANIATGADIDAVRAEMAADEKFLADWRRGQPDTGRLRNLSIAGINASQTDTVQSLQAKAAARFSQMNPADARAAELETGFSTRGRFLRQGNALVNAQVAAQMPVAVTKEQTEAYDRLGRAIRSVMTAYDGMVNKFMERNPQFAGAVETVDKWLRDLQSTPEGLKKVADALDAVAIGMIAIIVKFAALNPTLRLLLAVAAAYEGLRTLTAPESPEEKKFNEGRPGWSRWLNLPYLWRNRPNFLGGPRKPDASAPIPPPGTTGSISDPGVRAAGDFIAQEESRNRNINNFMYGQPGRTASGYHQITDSNWRKYGSELGIDLVKYPRTISAPRAVQDQVFAAMFGREGVTPWSTRAGGPMTPAKIAAMNKAMADARAKAVPTPSTQIPPAPSYAAIGAPGVKVNSRGEPYSTTLETMSPREAANVKGSMEDIKSKTVGGVPWFSVSPKNIPSPFGTGPDLTLLKSLKTIQAAKAAQAGGASTRNYDNDVTTGDIHVHTPAVNADGIATDVGLALKNRLRLTVNPFNEGLDG